MLKNFIESIKLSKLSYLLEIIEVRDFRSKINAFNKIRKMKISKEMGQLILDSAEKNSSLVFKDFNISLSLISLLFDNYYDEYSEALNDIYPKLNIDTKYGVLHLLSCTNKESAVVLYRDLVLKYGKELEDIPTGLLHTNKDNYDLLFPQIIKALKFDIKRNNILLLLNEFILSNVARESDIKKNKKVIVDSINNILKQGINYKFKKNENIMQNKDYIELRMFLESVINVEFYVNNKDTKANLEKLLSKKDNQLKLFILENYIKKGKDISKIKFNTIAKDPLSRYPLYSFLKFYNLERLMPKKYNNNLSLSESDLYINYSISNQYNSIPEKMEYIEDRVSNNYRYYIYKFTTKFNYKEEVKDVATDYILKNTSLDKELVDNSKSEYIGISGGYNKDIDPSIIEKNLTNIFYKKNIGDYEKIVEDLLPKKEVPLQVPIEKIKEKLPKKKKDKELIKQEKEDKKKLKQAKKELENVKKDKLEKASIPLIEEEEKEPSLLRKIFSFNTFLLLVCLFLLGCVFVLNSYINGNDILDLKKKTTSFSIININKSIEIKNDNYKEINYGDIFKEPQKEYYVMFYNKKKKSVYHSFIKTMLENNYVVYYVDTKKEENKPIFAGNPTGFVINQDTLLKVNDGEYEFYVVGKTNVIKELRDYINDINKKTEEEQKAKEKELKEKQEKEKRTKLENNITASVKSFIKPNKIKKTVSKVKYMKKFNVALFGKKVYNLYTNVEKEE